MRFALMNMPRVEKDKYERLRLLSDGIITIKFHSTHDCPLQRRQYLVCVFHYG